MLDWLKRKKVPIDFSEKNLTDLTILSDQLGQTLIDNGLGDFVDQLSRIRLAADAKNEVDFKDLIISRELFGGSGALWEIHIEDKPQYKTFNKQFCEYLDLVTRMGIRNRTVEKTRKLMPRLI
jgi:hypothetical protein